MAQGNGYISSSSSDEDNKPMLFMKKSIDSQGNNGLTALINKQLQGELSAKFSFRKFIPSRISLFSPQYFKMSMCLRIAYGCVNDDILISFSFNFPLSIQLGSNSDEKI